MRLYLFVLITVFAPITNSCGDSLRFEIDAVSPNKKYEIKLEGRQNPATALPGEFYTQNVKLEAKRDGEILIVEPNFFEADHYDPSFLDVYPAHQWSDNFILRFDNGKSQPFYDNVVIRNATEFHIDLLSIEYGRFQRFLIFDINPREAISLQCSPQFDRGQPALGLSYIAYSAGKSFSGSKYDSEQRKVEDGKIEMTVEISSKPTPSGS